MSTRALGWVVWINVNLPIWMILVVACAILSRFHVPSVPQNLCLFEASIEPAPPFPSHCVYSMFSSYLTISWQRFNDFLRSESQESTPLILPQSCSLIAPRSQHSMSSTTCCDGPGAPLPFARFSSSHNRQKAKLVAQVIIAI